MILILKIDRVYKISSKSQYVGDEASAWFSKLLNIECQMYQIYEPRHSIQNPLCRNVALPWDKVCLGFLSGGKYRAGLPRCLTFADCRLQTNSADKQYLSLRTHFKTVSFQLLKANCFKMGS